LTRSGGGRSGLVLTDLLLATRPRLVLDDGGVGKYAMEVRGLIGRPGTDHVVMSRPASAPCSTIRHLRCARRSLASEGLTAE